MAHNEFLVTAKQRSEQGKGASRRLRRLALLIPGIVYGGDTPPTLVSIEQKHLMKLLENEAFYSHILTLDIDGKTERAVLKDLQRHPYKPMVTHVDFQRVMSNQKIAMHVPLHFIGEAQAPGVRLEKGIVNRMATEIELRCLPDFLPEFLEVDLSNLKAGEAIHISDLKLPEHTESTELLHGNDLALASIQLPRAALEEAAAGPATDAKKAPEAAKKPSEKK